MNGPDAKGFFKAMEIEINQLAKMKAFVVVERTSSMNVISSVWALRRKRYPDGSIRKLKARICALTILKHMHLWFNGLLFG